MSRGLSSDRSWCLALAGLLTMSLGACTTAVRPQPPILDSLAIASITIAPLSLGEADASERKWFSELLGDQATTTARRMTVELRLAERVLLSRESPRSHHLNGSVSIPIVLPPEYRGSHAAFQKGALAVAQIELRDSSGKLVSTAQATVLWKDIHWTTGAHKIRRARQPDVVLIDAVDLAVKRALKRLLPELLIQPTTKSGLGARVKESSEEPV